MKNQKINIAVIGLGSCSSSLIQLLEASKLDNNQSGIKESNIGGYHLNDISVVTAFDVDSSKVGKDISEALKSRNISSVNHYDIGYTGIVVQPGPLVDGVEGRLSSVITLAEDSKNQTFENVTKELRNNNVDVVVNYLPTGANEAAKAYAYASADAGCAFINGMPADIANDKNIREYFIEKNLPLMGDDMRSHLGATTLHTALIDLVHSRGLKVKNTHQLNFGGNMDFFNLSDDSRSANKKKTKKSALEAAGLNIDGVSAGPNGYIEYLEDTKICYINLECESILNSNVNIEVKLTVEDSPNSAGVIANAIRIGKATLDNGITGVIEEVCPYLFKNAPKPMSETDSLKSFEHFIKNIGGANND